MNPTTRKKKKKASIYRLRNFNARLVFYAIVLSILGIVIVNSASVNEVQNSMFSTVQKQMLAFAIGLILMTILAFIDYHKLVKYAWVLYFISLALLFYVRFINTYAIMGAKRWIYIRGFGTIQPSEFSKIALAVMGSWLLPRMREKINNFFVLLLYFAILGSTAVLILIEPNLSTTIEVVFGIVMMLFLAGISWKWVTAAIAAVAILLGSVLYSVYQPEQPILQYMVEKNIIQDYQLNRINAYFFPEDYPDLVYQQTNSVLAIGGGQLNGKGLNTSTLESVKNGGFLSEEQSDFIFAVAGEELGFIGCAFLIFLYICLMIEGFRISSRAPDAQGRIIAGGLISIFSFQTFVNIGVATMLLPNTGTPLPFISAGMSSMLGSYMMIGILLNINFHKKRNLLTEGAL